MAQQNPTQQPQISITSSTGTQYASRTISLLARAFSTDPIFTHLTNSVPDQDRRFLAREKLFRCMCKLFTLDDAIFYEASVVQEEGDDAQIRSGGGGQSFGQGTKEESIDVNISSGGGQSSGQGTKEESTSINIRAGGGQSSGQGTKEESSTLQEDRHSDNPQFHSALILARPGPKTDWFTTATGLLTLLRSGVLSLMFLLGLRQFWRISDEYQLLVDPVKKAYFTSILNSASCPTTFKSSDDYYEIKFIATDEKCRGKGLCPAMIRDVQKRVRKEGRPVWMEASNAKARRQYLKLGFRDVGEALVIGRGISDADGEKASGERAKGVDFWPLVWWPNDGVDGVEK